MTWLDRLRIPKIENSVTAASSVQGSPIAARCSFGSTRLDLNVRINDAEGGGVTGLVGCNRGFPLAPRIGGLNNDLYAHIAVLSAFTGKFASTNLQIARPLTMPRWTSERLCARIARVTRPCGSPMRKRYAWSSDRSANLGNQSKS